MNAEPTAAETKSQTKAKGPEEWFPHSVDFAGDLEVAWKLWDAVSESPIPTVRCGCCLAD
jgi:hypothetical protein